MGVRHWQNLEIMLQLLTEDIFSADSLWLQGGCWGWKDLWTFCFYLPNSLFSSPLRCLSVLTELTTSSVYAGLEAGPCTLSPTPPSELNELNKRRLGKAIFHVTEDSFEKLLTTRRIEEEVKTSEEKRLNGSVWTRA